MKVVCYGAGQMGGAMIRGLLKSGFVTAENLFVRGGSNGTAEALQAELGFRLLRKEEDLNTADVIIIATIPKVVASVLKELKGSLKKEAIVISVAGEPSLGILQSGLSSRTLVARAIPNTPVQICAGMTGVTFSANFNETQKDMVLELFKALGDVIEVPEAKLGTVGTVAGCAPAFVDLFMEALADAAVLNGLTRKEAYQIIPQMVQGAGKLMQETGSHPGELKDQVCSPGGSTIRGVAVLEQYGLRNAVIQAVNRANHE